MNKPKALQKLISLTNKHIDHVPATPTDFNDLSLRIRKQTGIMLSSSTLKRIWGYVIYSGFPSQNTLNTLCNFIGLGDWQSFLLNFDDKDETEVSDFIDLLEVDPDRLNIGEVVKVFWHGGKGCEMEYMGDKRFRILRSFNIKLTEGDAFQIDSLKVGNPFCALDINRKGKIIPGYVGARSTGISYLEII